MASRNPARSSRFSRTSQTPEEDCYRLDPLKTPRENLFEVYQGLSSRKTKENRRLCLLNALVKLWDDHREINLGFNTEELLYCLSASLIHTFTQIRAGTLRALRHLLSTPKDLQTFNSLQMPYLICRSLDVLLKNEEERVQALKLIRKMLSISSNHISPSLVRCLVSLGESGTEDRMLRAYLAVLCEFGVLNPRLLIVCGGVSVITRNVLECHSPRIAESLCGVLLHLLERPHTRNIASVRLDCLAAPYCDFTYRLGIMDKHKDARDLRFTCSRLALLSVLRSFTGVLEFCNPNRPSGLKAIVDILYLNQLEVRKAILELLYEILGLPQPIWTDECSAGLAVDPAEFQDIWRLSDGFVAAEGRSILPSLASHVPNICEIHMALLLYCFLETGLLNALIEVIITSDSSVSVRATVLLGKIVQMMHMFLPSDISSLSSALPLLVSKATEGNYQARAAISTLQNYHQMLRNRPAACSLFLDNIIQSGGLIHTRLFKRDINSEEARAAPPIKYSTMERSGRKRHDSISSNASGGVATLSDLGSYDIKDENTSLFLGTSGRRKPSKFLQIFEIRENERLMRESNVLINHDGIVWDWDIVITILKLPSKKMTNKMDDNQCKFIHKLVHYFKPSSNRFSHQDLGHGRHVPSFVAAGLILIDWLLQSQELECIRLLTDLFTDVHAHLLAITTSRSAHDCLFSPQHMTSTMCQQYFLFIGKMCKNEKGLSILYNTDIFKQLQKLVTSTSHICYIKLLVSGLDYSLEGHPRKILEYALTETPHTSARLYATQFLLVLLRAKIPNFEVWGIPLLIKQTLDKEKSIVLAALEIIDEACHDRTYLEELVNVWPNFSTSFEGDAGKLVEMRFYSIPRGLNHPKAKIQQEIDCWVNGYNKKYVLLLEADTHSTMTLHTKSEDGTYSRRNCSTRPILITPNILPHLYGQLVQTTKGMTCLQKYGDLPKLIEALKLAKCENETECLFLKAAIWALGHVATSTEGVDFLNDPLSRVYEKLIFLAKHAENFSIRATCLNVLSLIGCTNAGANVLFKLDWMSVRHDRNTFWPVYEEEDWFSKQLTPVRHQLGDITPYNYTSLQENASYMGGANTTEDIGAFYFDETIENSQDDVEALIDTTNGEIGSSTRSKTLPEASYTVRSFFKHTRSLSESKTTDGISLQRPTSRQRFNSGGTDSNTSGVSSCDSIYGRNVITELHHTLSPIPSSSNLMDIKKSSEDKFRRMSLTGVRYREHATMTSRDVQGYATLRSLRRHFRPMLSESAADELTEIMASPPNLIRSNKLSLLTSSQRKMKVRSLDRQYSFVGQSTSTGLDYSELEDMRQNSNTSRLLNQNDTKGPCYSGISLPKNLSDIFPSSNDTSMTSGTYVSLFIKDLENIETTSSLNLSNVRSSLLSESINEGDEGESVVSSISDLSITSKKTRWNGKHNRNECLHCCRSKVSRMQLRTDSESSFVTRKKLHQQNSLQLSDVSFNSPESVLSDESIPDRITGNILRHVQRMANPVWSKMSKMALLDLKQKHPHSFQDICLYSEVCKALGRNTYRYAARRFLQEIFLDLNFDSFYNESNDIIERHDIDDDSIIIINRNDRDDRNCNNNNELHILQIQPQSSTSLFKLKSPPLASLFETSIENLSESLNFKSNKLNLISHTKQLQQSLPTQNNNSNNDKINQRDITDSSVISTSTTVKETFRPRLHTIELDLSCTKNKFPIRDRNITVITSPNLFPYPRKLGAAGKVELITSTASQYQQQSAKSLSSSTPTGNLYCERRLFSKSEATLIKK